MADHWRPIDDLPGDWAKLRHTEFESLAVIWGTGCFAQKQIRCARLTTVAKRMAIETGIIEYLCYRWGITEILIEKGIEESLIPHGTR